MPEESGSVVRLLDTLSLTQVQDKPPIYEFSCNGHESAVQVPLERLRIKHDVDHIMFNAWGFYPLAALSPGQWREIIKEWAKPPDLLEYNRRGKVTGVDVDRLVDDISECFHFKTFIGTTRAEVLVYEGGVYIPKGEEVIKVQCEAKVDDAALTSHTVNEVLGHVIRRTACKRTTFNTDPNTLNLNNGLLNIKTRELRPHSPYFLSTTRIPITYDPEAKCPAIDRFLSEVLKPEHVPLIYEFAGYSTLPEYSMQQAFMFTGWGSNGKSTCLLLLSRFLGQENCSSISLQRLEESDFAASFLEGKLLNVVADVSPERIRSDRAMFKRLTGGDLITTEKKFQDPFTFSNYAKLLFSAQIPPKTSDDSYAFWRRWVMVNFPFEFRGDQVDKYLIDKLTTPQELSGFLNLALDGLDRIQVNGKFSYDISPEQVERQWTLATEPVKAFAQEHCELGSNYEVSRTDLYKAYQRFCFDNNIQLMGESAFGRALRFVPGLSLRDVKHRVGGEERRHYSGIRLNETGKNLLVDVDWS